MKRTLLRILQAVLPLVLLGLAGLAAVTMIRNRPVVETRPPDIAPPGVRVHVVALEDVALAVTSEGTVRPRTESELVPEVSGRVMSVAPSFAEGGFFEAGDVLVTIDPFDYEQAVVASRAQLAQSRLRLAEEEAEAEVAQREWDSLGEGDPRELTLRKPQLDDARAAVAAAEASLVRAERDLERASITAPYAGRVRRKGVDVGQFVTMGSSVATVYAVDRAEIRLPLPDNELAYLNLPLSYRGGENRQGPRVTLRSTFAGESHAWNGRIVRTESEIDPISRMVHVVAEVDDPYRPGPDPDRPPLAVGMYVDAQIEGRRFRQIAVVPRSGLRGRSQVMVVDGESRLRFRNVEILRMTAGSIYVRAGLANGERVVVSTLDSPTDGMQVQVTNPTPDLLAEGTPDAGAGAGAPATPAPPAPAQASPAAMPPAATAAAPGARRAGRAPGARRAASGAGPGAPAAPQPASAAAPRLATGPGGRRPGGRRARGRRAAVHGHQRAGSRRGPRRDAGGGRLRRARQHRHRDGRSRGRGRQLGRGRRSRAARRRGAGHGPHRRDARRIHRAHGQGGRGRERAAAPAGCHGKGGRAEPRRRPEPDDGGGGDTRRARGGGGAGAPVHQPEPGAGRRHPGARGRRSRGRASQPDGDVHRRRLGGRRALDRGRRDSARRRPRPGSRPVSSTRAEAPSCGPSRSTAPSRS